MSGYWPGPWSCEDGGPRRLQIPAAGTPELRVHEGQDLVVSSRLAPVATMAVTREPGELYLLRHEGGPEATCSVERIDPETLEPSATSGPLPGGPVWPGSLAAHANGSLYVVFGDHAHRLDPDLGLLATRQLPRHRPYNGFVVLPDGTVVTKDFAGSRPGLPVGAAERERSELVALEPETLAVIDRCELAEPSIARLSADGSTVYVVGDTSLRRVGWDGAKLRPDDELAATYRTREGQSFGWDCVIAGGAAWFLDDGDGTEAYAGTLRGLGLSAVPLSLWRVDLVTGAAAGVEICGLPGGLVANPPAIDVRRGVAVGYDSGNGVMQALSIGPRGELTPRWRRQQDHASHLVLLEEAGQLVTGDFDAERGVDQVVVLDIDSGVELARADTASPLQPVVFPAVGFSGDVYVCSFSHISRVQVQGGLRSS